MNFLIEMMIGNDAFSLVNEQTLTGYTFSFVSNSLFFTLIPQHAVSIEKNVFPISYLFT